MCIIVAIPANAEFPKAETLEQCFRRNPDGAGFMYSDGKKVRIRKGFMKFEEFVDAIENEEIPEESAVVMHFRIATSGRVKPMCCHPFPVSSKKEDLQALAIDSRWGVAHNGVISGMTTYEGWSDTMDFVSGVIAPLARMNPSFMNSEDAVELLEGACKSKLAILDNAGDLMLVGNFVEDGGVFYSNTTYLPVTYNYTSYGKWWQDAYYEDERAWDDVEKLVENLKWQACELCTERYDCAEYGEWCATERHAIETCADTMDCSASELAELLGWPTYQMAE